MGLGLFWSVVGGFFVCVVVGSLWVFWGLFVFLWEFSSLIAKRAVLHSEVCFCLHRGKYHAGKPGEGPCQCYREDSTTGWAALLLVTVTRRMESNTSTHLLLDISCAWSFMGI